MKTRKMNSSGVSAGERPRQSVDHFGGDAVVLHGQKYELRDLCMGVLVSGATGCGKTVGVVNQLAEQLVRTNSDDSPAKAAMVYINAKGAGAADFLSRIPSSRHGDVVTIGFGHPISFHLFDRTCWENSSELAEAVVAYILEVARHASGTADTEGNHKVYFDGLRDRPLRVLARIGHSANRLQESTDIDPVRHFTPRSHLLAVIRRVRAFCELMRDRIQKAKGNQESRMAFRRAFDSVVSQFAVDASDLRQRVQAIVHSGDDIPATDRAAAMLVHSLLKWSDKGDPVLPVGSSNLFARWNASLSEEEQKELQSLIEFFDSVPENNALSTLAALDAVCDDFGSGPMEKIVCDENGSAVPHSFESVIDQGKILVIDLPPADSAGASRFALMSLGLALMATTLRRYQARFGGRKLNQRRPIVVVADEFHSYLCTTGRHEGLENWLSRSREFGVIPILAVQNLNLLTLATRSSQRAFALLGNLRTRFFGQNSCPETNAWAAYCCGDAARVDTSPVINWHHDPALARAVGRLPAERGPVLAPRALTGLERGEFIIQRTDGAVLQINTNHRLPVPLVTTLARAVA